jgi:hypothetical protein
MTASSASSKPTMIIVTAIVSVVIGILNLCGGFAAVTGGALLGGLGAAANQAAQESGDAAAGQAAAALGAVGGGLFAIFGIVFLVIGIALIVDAVGLFQGKPWSWMLTLVLYGIYLVITIIGWVINRDFSVLNLVFVVLAGAIIYLFYTSADIKRALGKL